MGKRNNTLAEREELSLLELNSRVRMAVSTAFPNSYWVRAEMSDVRTNTTSGHCYLEFVEKNPVTGQLEAKVKANIWSKIFRMLKPYFEQETGQAFTSGLKVLVKVTVDVHELYGYTLTVLDIDPTYTLGDMARKRLEIIRQLQEEGVFTLNKELQLPTLPKRIAVITSSTAAGYEDFLNQLTHNRGGYPFYTKLFPALMQGDKTEDSIIDALDLINDYLECFDVVVIIRGGGSTSDLSSFDSYLLAANCAQFPLPIITGIGHERDDTILDMVAHTRMKTPTAVAEFLIGRMDIAAQDLIDLQQEFSILATDMLNYQKNFLQLIGNRLPVIVSNRIERSRSGLNSLTGKLPSVASSSLSQHQALLKSVQSRLQNGVHLGTQKSARFLELTEQYIKMTSPDYILKRGYSLTLMNGQIVKHATELKKGDELVTRFSDGEVKSVISGK